MNTWAPLWSGIVDSSIWAEPDYVCKVFITMLALKDSDHIVRQTAFGLGLRCWPGEKDTEERVLKALKVLAAPDKRRLEPQPHDGRRIEKVEDGWLILNGEMYRKRVSDEMRKARLRRAQTVYRQRHAGQGTPTKGEKEAVKALNSGDVARFERIAASP